MNKTYKIIAQGDVNQFIKIYKKQTHGFNLDREGYNLLHYASIAGQIEIIDFLLKNGVDIDLLSKDGYSSIVYAIINRHNDVIKYFLDNGFIKRGTNDFLALITASSDNQIDILETLVEAGLDINEKDQDGTCFSPLHYAAQEGHFGIVKYLIERGAEINMVDNNGLSPLRMASDHKHYEIVQYLINYGAKINLGGALHNACAWGRLKTVKFLIDNGADINAIDEEGKTPLFYALSSESKSIISVLLKKGANPALTYVQP